MCSTDTWNNVHVLLIQLREEEQIMKQVASTFCHNLYHKGRQPMCLTSVHFFFFFLGRFMFDQLKRVTTEYIKNYDKGNKN